MRNCLLIPWMRQWAPKLSVAVALVQVIPAVMAQSSLQPLPRCDAQERLFYLMRYANPSAAGMPPTVSLDLTTVPTSGATTSQEVWSGLGAPPVSPREIARAPNTSVSAAGASVAGGMGKDGFIYAMRAVDGDNDWDNSPAAGWNSGWRSHTRYYEMLRYGRNGVENLGVVHGLGTYWTNPTDSATAINGAALGTTPETYLDNRLGGNFNAADIDPVTGIMYLARFQGGGPLNKVFRIDVSQSPPQFLSTLTLSTPIPGAQSGDFAIDSTGTWAYGIATSGSGLNVTSTHYRFNLTSGVVESIGSSAWGPYGAGARLSGTSNQMVFVGRTGLIGYGARVMTAPAGTLASNQSALFSDSSDAASCLPKFVATLECTPTALVDADDNIAVCTVTVDSEAPVGGLSIALQLPPTDPRFSTSCDSEITIAAGQTTAQCTITATPNTIPGDGDVTASIGLAEPASAADYVLGTAQESTISIQNDDQFAVNLVCSPTEIFDSPNQIVTCTVSANAPAPQGGLSVVITPPPAHSRYTSTCASPLQIPEGASSVSCTLTATPNTVAGDGDIPVEFALQAGTNYGLGDSVQANVTVRDDDSGGVAGTIKQVPGLGWLGVLVLGLALGGLGVMRKRASGGTA